MGARHLIRAGVTLVVCALVSACATIQTSRPTPEAEESAGITRSPVLGQKNRDFALALAHYSEAIRSEITDNRPAAISNYLAAAALDPSNDALQFRVALTLLQEKRVEDAIALMEKSAKDNPASERTLIWLALIYRSAEQNDKALETYRRVTELFPSSAVAYIERAALLTRQGDDDGASRLLESAISRVHTNEADDVTRTLGEIYLRKATAESQAGRRWPHLGDARKRMEAATRQWPDDQAILLMLGNLRAIDNDIAGAIECYDVLEKKNPDDLTIKEKLAISLMATGNKTGAVAALQGIAAKQPTNGRVFYFLGELHEQLGQTNNAILNYNLAGKNAPDDPLPFLKSAILNAAAGHRDEAEKVLRRGLEGAPGQVRLQEMLAYVLMDEKRYSESLVVFAKAATSLATPAGRTLTQNFLVNYSIALLLGGLPDDAVSTLVEASQTNAVAVDAFASFLMREGNSNAMAAAAGVLAKFEEKVPADPRAPMFRGLLLNALDRHTDAVEAFERAEKLASASPQPDKVLTSPFYFWYGAACERSSNTTRAATLFLKAIELNPANTEARNYVAYMWAERGERLDDALTQIRKALETEPGNPAFLDTLGWIYFMQGKVAMAFAETERALKSAEAADDPTINEHMGDILAKLARAAEAIAHWKRAFVCGNETPALAAKLRAAGIDPKSLEAEAAAFRAKKKQSDPPNK